MARALSALLLAIFFGCANPTRTLPPPRLDFGLDHGDMAVLPLEYPDLAVPPDLAVADQGVTDQAVADQAVRDQGGPDQGTTHDLAAPDLATANCSDAGTTGHLFLAAVGNANALVTSRFDESSGWSAYQVSATPTAGDVSEAVFAGRPMVVARQQNNALTAAEADPCSQEFPSLAPLVAGVTTALRPALLDGTDLVFRGASGGDLKLYYMQRAATWQAPVQQAHLTSNTAFALLRFESVLQAFFLDGTKLSTGQVSAAGSGAESQILSNTASQPPTAIVDQGGTLHVVFAGSDTNLYWIWRRPGDAWASGNQHLLCDGQSGCQITTNLPISLALDASGTPLVAWVGKSPDQVFTTRLISTTGIVGASGTQFWEAPQAASGSCGTKDCQSTVGPALATGVGAAAAELLFVSDLDGRARHARLMPADLSFAWAEPASIAGTNLLNTPALIAEP